MGLFSALLAWLKGEPAVSKAAGGWGAPSTSVPSGNPGTSTGARYVVLDVETTGLSPQRDRVLELALVTVDASGRVLDEWTTRVNPQGPVGATHIHGITAADVARAPIFSDVLGEVTHRLSGAAVVAHNAAFDLAFLRAEFARAGWKMPFLPCLCTLEASSYYLPGLSRRRLADCCAAAGIRLEHAHAALGDARATAQLLRTYISAQVPPSPRAADLDVTKAATTVSWPTAPHPVSLLSTGPDTRVVRPAAARRPTAKPPSAPLVQLVSRFSLEEALEEGAHPASMAYLETLADALSDGILTDDEAEDLQELASVHGLHDSDVSATHTAFVLALAHQALADGRVSRAERDELMRLAALLGLDGRLVPHLTKQAEAARQRKLGEGLAPLPVAWDLGEPLRVGDKVVFTGCDETERARLETVSEDRGVLVMGSVSRRIAMLVTDGSMQGTKWAEARALAMRTVTPQQYAVLLRHIQPAVVAASRGDTPLDSTQVPSRAIPDADRQSGPAPRRVAESRHAADASIDPAAVRAWAREQGIEVGTRGRLPATLIDAYRASVGP